MGEWILREACREAASWPKPLQIAVNLSPVQFRHGDLPVAGACDPAGDRPRAAPPRARDHRRRADRRFLARGVDPAAAEGARRAHRDGRFRHRLFVAVLSAVVPVRQDQDRPDLHLQSRPRTTIRRPSCAPSSGSGAASICRCWPRASRPPSSSHSSRANPATRSRAISSAARPDRRLCRDGRAQGDSPQLKVVAG